MTKYEIGDFVLYGVDGACQIVEIGPLSFAGPDKIYYSMKPVSDGRSTIYLPVLKENEIIRKVISKEEALEIVEKANNVNELKIVADRENCEPVIKSGDNLKIASLIKLFRKLRKDNKKMHKGLNIQEEKILREAEIVYFSELSTALDMSMDEAIASYSPCLDPAED